MIATQPATQSTIQEQPKQKRKQSAKRQEPVLRIFKDEAYWIQNALNMKESFFERGLPLTEKLIDSYLGCSGYWLLAYYFHKEIETRQKGIGTLDPSEWNDDPDGYTVDEYGLKLAKAWREDFFKSGLPFVGDIIAEFYYAFGKNCDAVSTLLKYYIEQEIEQEKAEAARKTYWAIEKIEYENVG